MSIWGAAVITGLFSSVPDIVLFWTGGFSYESNSMRRYFELHFVLPFVLLAVAVLHLAVLHALGSNCIIGTRMQDKISTFLFTAITYDLLFALFVVCVHGMQFLATIALSHPDNSMEASSVTTPAHIVPEWYFLPYYSMLKGVPDVDSGVCVFILSVIVIHGTRLQTVPLCELLISGNSVLLTYLQAMISGSQVPCESLLSSSFSLTC